MAERLAGMTRDFLQPNRRFVVGRAWTICTAAGSLNVVWRVTVVTDDVQRRAGSTSEFTPA